MSSYLSDDPQATRPVEPPPAYSPAAPETYQPYVPTMDPSIPVEPRPNEVLYVPLAVTVGDGFKLGCGFALALAVAVLAALVVVALIVAIGGFLGVALPFGR